MLGCAQLEKNLRYLQCVHVGDLVLCSVYRHSPLSAGAGVYHWPRFHFVSWHPRQLVLLSQLLFVFQSKADWLVALL